MSAPTAEEIAASNATRALLGPVQIELLADMRASLAAIEAIHNAIGSAGTYSFDGVADTLPDIKTLLNNLGDVFSW